MVKIDGQIFDIPVLYIKRKAEFLDKHATRTAMGSLKRELIGVYFNYELKFGKTTKFTEYDRLWEVLSLPQEFHVVSVPYGQGEISFKAYLSNVSDEVRAQSGGHTYWQGLTVSFIAESPARRS